MPKDKVVACGPQSSKAMVELAEKWAQVPESASGDQKGPLLKEITIVLKHCVFEDAMILPNIINIYRCNMLSLI